MKGILYPRKVDSVYVLMGFNLSNSKVEKGNRVTVLESTKLYFSFLVIMVSNMFAAGDVYIRQGKINVTSIIPTWN